MKRILTIDLDNLPRPELLKCPHADLLRFCCFDTIINKLIDMSKCDINEDYFNLIDIVLDTIEWLRRNPSIGESKCKELLLIYILKDL
ncbi:MAG: hypothetical protein LLG40_06825, partial [Deltaproteobacteria bacterium]|nr:hypothetical protein [Deltaproteobacteria bacterium]